jgi:microcompartment protein CcmK/EutM
MNSHSWIVDVLEDVRLYARRHELPGIEKMLLDVAETASRETGAGAGDLMAFIEGSRARKHTSRA